MVVEEWAKNSLGLEWPVFEQVSIGWWLLGEGCNGVGTIGNSGGLSIEEGIAETDGGFGDKWGATDVAQGKASNGKIKGKVECIGVNWEWDDEDEAKKKSNSWNMTWWEMYILLVLISRQIKPLCLKLKSRKEQWVECIYSLWELKESKINQRHK